MLPLNHQPVPDARMVTLTVYDRSTDTQVASFHVTSHADIPRRGEIIYVTPQRRVDGDLPRSWEVHQVTRSYSTTVPVQCYIITAFVSPAPGPHWPNGLKGVVGPGSWAYDPPEPAPGRRCELPALYPALASACLAQCSGFADIGEYEFHTCAPCGAAVADLNPGATWTLW